MADSQARDPDSYLNYAIPDGLETAVCWLHGIDPPAVSDLGLPVVGPRAALDRALLPVVARPPCYVLFSGGLDSSLVLAAATSVARREQLPDPIPVTERYPTVPAADESDWQNLVVKHLGLREWIRVSMTDEGDLLGEVARAGLEKRGLVFPPTIHAKVNTMRQMADGVVLSGEGGDEVFGARRVAPIAAWLRGEHARWRFRQATQAAMPSAYRRRISRRQRTAQLSSLWLTPEALRAHARLLAADEASEPLRWDQSIRWAPRRRASRATFASRSALAAEYGSVTMDPLLDAGFLESLASWGGGLGMHSRAAILSLLFDDLLPAELIARPTKASFNLAFMGEPTRQFAAEWDGSSGVDLNLVDPERLRRAWLADVPPGPSGLLVQAAWLAQRGAR